MVPVGTLVRVGTLAQQGTVVQVGTLAQRGTVAQQDMENEASVGVADEYLPENIHREVKVRAGLACIPVVEAYVVLVGESFCSLF
jgi:uncharacterized protein YgbK (DUF1537 family)